MDILQVQGCLQRMRLSSSPYYVLHNACAAGRAEDGPVLLDFILARILCQDPLLLLIARTQSRLFSFSDVERAFLCYTVAREKCGSLIEEALEPLPQGIT